MNLFGYSILEFLLLASKKVRKIRTIVPFGNFGWALFEIVTTFYEVIIYIRRQAHVQGVGIQL